MTTASRFLGRDAPATLQLVQSKDSYLFDSRGKRYIDFMAGWGVGNFGWGRAAVIRAMKRYRGPEYVPPGFGYKPWDELAALLVSIAPGKMRKVFRATGGSEAVELALQAAMVHTGRKAFLSLEGSYHGNTTGGLSIGTSEKRETLKNLPAGCYKVSPPLDGRAMDAIERRLKGREVAAFIMEPVPINLGVLIPNRPFMTELQRQCRKYGALLIMDEVATGFGRTGALFASEHFDSEPDVMCLGKALSGGSGAIGAMMATEAVGKSMEKEGNFYSTYGWHPRSTESALVTLRDLIKNRKALLSHVAELSGLFETRLNQIDFPSSAAIRVKGLAMAVELEKPEEAERIQKACQRNGVILAAEGETLLLLPPLTIPRQIAEEGLRRLKQAAEG